MARKGGKPISQIPLSGGGGYQPRGGDGQFRKAVSTRIPEVPIEEKANKKG